MGMTVGQLIASALRQIVPGISPNSTEYDDGMQALNLLLQEWSLTPAGRYGLTREEFALTASDAEYTLGPGGDFSTVKPVRLHKVFTRTDGIDYPCEVYYSSDEYAAETQKALSDRPSKVLVLEGGTTNTLLFYPTPDSAYAVHIWSFKGFNMNSTTSFAYTSTTQSLGLPPQYEPALKWNLAAELCEEFGKPLTQRIAMRADETLKKLRLINQRPVPPVNTDVFSTSGGGYDIDSDTWK